MLKRLSHVCLGVANIDESLAFYAGTLGAQIAHEFRNAGQERYGVMLACGQGTFIELFLRRSPALNSNAPEPDAGFRHLCFEVDDIEATAGRLRSLGYECAVRRGRTDHVLQLLIRDPDGIAIEFHQHDKASVLRPWVCDDETATRGKPS